MPFLRSAKGLVLKAANRSGVSTVVASSRWRQQRLLVLCYHGVSRHDEHEWSDLFVSPAHLECRLELLRRSSANVVPFSDAVPALYDGSLPDRAVSITFDDGACDFAQKAAPLLTAANMHSTVYLCTYYCRKDLPVFDPVLSYVLWKGRGRTVQVPGINAHLTIPQFANDPEFQALHRQLLRYAAANDMDAEEKHDFARRVAWATGADFEELCERRLFYLMNEREIRSLDPNLVSVQMHTHRHRTPSSLAQLQEELDRNTSEIASLTGRSDPVRHFCFPSGVHTPELVEWLRLSGVQSATTCEPNYATSSTPPLQIPRFVDTMGASADTFRAWVLGSAAVGNLFR